MRSLSRISYLTSHFRSFSTGRTLSKTVTDWPRSLAHAFFRDPHWPCLGKTRWRWSSGAWRDRWNTGESRAGTRWVVLVGRKTWLPPERFRCFGKKMSSGRTRPVHCATMVFLSVRHSVYGRANFKNGFEAPDEWCIIGGGLIWAVVKREIMITFGGVKDCLRSKYSSPDFGALQIYTVSFKMSGILRADFFCNICNLQNWNEKATRRKYIKTNK